MNACVAQGLSVIQGDADSGPCRLSGRRVRLRDPEPDDPGDAAARAPCSSSSFASAGARSSRPEFRALARCAGQVADRRAHAGDAPHRLRWYNSPNIHLCTIRDFTALAAELGASIERALPLDRDGRPMRESLPVGLSNLIAPQALFVLGRD